MHVPSQHYATVAMLQKPDIWGGIEASSGSGQFIFVRFGNDGCYLFPGEDLCFCDDFPHVLNKSSAHFHCNVTFY